MANEPRILVLDTSVGVKWIKLEEGRSAALALLNAHRSGTARILVSQHFVTELIAVAVRGGGAEMGERVWEALRLAELVTVGLDHAVASEVFRQCRLLGCSFYDALPAAVAVLAGATLYSADARAHARFPSVELI